MNHIQLSPGDNIVVLAFSVPAGEAVLIGDKRATMAAALGLGNKLAPRARNALTRERALDLWRCGNLVNCVIPAKVIPHD